MHDKDSEFTFLGVNFKAHELSIGEDKFARILSKLTASSKKPDITQSVESINAYISHLKTISLKLFSPAQKDRFCLHFDEVLTNLTRKFLKTIDKHTLADA